MNLHRALQNWALTAIPVQIEVSGSCQERSIFQYSHGCAMKNRLPLPALVDHPVAKTVVKAKRPWGTDHRNARNIFAFMLWLSVLLSPILCRSATVDAYPFERPQQRAQFDHLLRELRCLVCQNQDLADSSAPLAKDLRRTVYQLVQAGQSDNEITGYLTDRYGDFILFKPPVKTVTLLLWFGPVLFLILGMIIFWKTIFGS